MQAGVSLSGEPLFSQPAHEREKEREENERSPLSQVLFLGLVSEAVHARIQMQRKRIGYTSAQLHEGLRGFALR